MYIGDYDALREFLNAGNSTKSTHITGKWPLSIAKIDYSDAEYDFLLTLFVDSIWDSYVIYLKNNIGFANIKRKMAHKEGLKLLIYNICRSISADRYDGMSVPLGRKGCNSLISYDILMPILHFLSGYEPGKPCLNHPSFRCKAYRGLNTEETKRRTRLVCQPHFKDELARAGLLPAPKPTSKDKVPPHVVSIRRKEKGPLHRIGRKSTDAESCLSKATKLLQSAVSTLHFDDYHDFEKTFYKADDKHRYSCLNRRNVKLYRGFSYQDGWGGRIQDFSGLNQLPFALRQRLQFHDEETVEFDYQGMQVRLAYSEVGASIGDEDPYSIPGFEDVPRSVFKSIFTVTVGCGPEKDVLRAIRSDLREKDIPLDGRKIKDLYNAFWDHHSPIAFMCQGSSAWKWLQYRESEIALRVIGRLTDKGIAVLPIHDGFRVARSHEETLHQAMLDAVANLSHPPTPIRRSQ